MGLALSRNLCRLGESLRPSASVWAGSRVGSSLHARILTPPPLAGLHVCRLNLRPSSFVFVVVMSPLDPPPLLSRRVGRMSYHMRVYITCDDGRRRRWWSDQRRGQARVGLEVGLGGGDSVGCGF